MAQVAASWRSAWVTRHSTSSPTSAGPSRSRWFGAARCGDDPDEHHQAPADHRVGRDRDQVGGLEAVCLRSAVAEDALERGDERSANRVDEADEGRLRGSAEQLTEEPGGDQDVDDADDEANHGRGPKVVTPLFGHRN